MPQGLNPPVAGTKCGVATPGGSRDRLSRMNDLLGFHHVAVTIRDLDASVAWYREVLGFEQLFREEAPERRACVMRFPNGSYGVGLVEYPTVPFEPFDPRHSGLDHLAFTVGSLDEL